MTLVDRVARARDCFARAGVTHAEAAADAEVLARHALGWDRATWLARRRDPAPADFETRYAPLAERRERREPVSYITGRREFWGLTFAVGPTVLTPRPESESIIETAIELLGDRRKAPLAIVDVGTGSGCLAVTLAHLFPLAVLTAVDVSSAALAVARRNATVHGVAHRIVWVEAPLADWLAGSPSDGCGRIDLLVANLPYIPGGAIASLAPEVRLHEPRIALDGGPDGLDPLRELLHAAPASLNPDARVIVEIGMGQADTLRDLVAAARGVELLDIRPDLQGIPRTAVIAAAKV
jgi:release factor glutamine methyltransferase